MLDVSNKEESLVWAAKSAIQKAIRRSDLSLVKTSFGILWESKAGRSWLKWRLPILVEEEAWYFISECSLFLERHGEIENTATCRKAWLKFLFTLALIPKSKDSEPLYYLSVSGAKPVNSEIASFRELLKENSNSTAYEQAELLLRRVLSGDLELTEYELSGIKLMVQRAKSGGLASDPWACLACIFLILNRGIGEYEVQQVKQAALKSVSEKPIVLLSFPWWIFDQHTRLGNKVIRFFEFDVNEKEFMDEKLLKKMFFLFESAKIPRAQLNATEVKPGPDCFESILWVPYMNNELKGRSRSVKALKQHWKASVRPRLKEAILGEMKHTGMDLIGT